MADRSVRPLRHLVHAVTGGQPPSEAQVRQAAWIARCVGRGGSAPLHRDDVSALAETLQVKEFAPGAVVFHADQTADGVWIVRRLDPSDLPVPGPAGVRAAASYPPGHRTAVAVECGATGVDCADSVNGHAWPPAARAGCAAPARRGNRCPYRTCPTHPRRNAWSAAPIDQQDSQGVRARPIDHRRVCGHRDHRPTRITRPGSMTQRRSHGPQRQHVGAEFVH